MPPTAKVLHFKTNYLNLSETFVDRLVRNHVRYRPVITTMRMGSYVEGLPVDEARHTGVVGVFNRAATKLDLSPPHLYRRIREEQPDVVHGHFGRDAFRALPAATAMGKPTLVNFYGHDVSRLPTRALWRLRYRLLARAGAHFVAPSRDLMGILLDRYGFPEDRMSLVKVGLDFSGIEYRPRVAGGPRLVTAGRLVEKKGFVYAVEAVARLRGAGQDVTLDIFGEGPERGVLEARIAAERLGDRVTLHGSVANETLLDTLAGYDVFLAPSVTPPDGDREGIPQTIVEAMASGLPVVGSDHAGLPELIVHEETGLVAAERDAEGLARGIARFLREPDLAARVSAAGHLLAKREHAVERHVAGIEDGYDRAIDWWRSRRTG